MKTITLLLCGCMMAAALQGQDTLRVPETYNSIQAAINDATENDIVLVSEGTYGEQINFLGKAITVASKFFSTGNPDYIDNTIIDGDGVEFANPDSCSLVYFINEEDTNSVLCGFTIRHGRGTYHTYSNETFNAGGAIFIHTAGARIINNHITENHLNDIFPGSPKYVDGAGIAIYGNTNKWVVIDHNIIDSNSCFASQADAARFAGILVFDHNCTIENNDISSNTCIGDNNAHAICCAFAYYSLTVNVYTAIVQSNVFRYNYVQSEQMAYDACGGIQNCMARFCNNLVEYNQSDGQSTAYWDGGTFELIDPGPGSYIKGNTFRGNTTYRLGGALNLAHMPGLPDPETVIVENNYFLENVAANGGAFYSRNIPVLLQNNVFSRNYSSSNGGAVYLLSGAFQPTDHLATFINNTFSGNQAEGNGETIYSNNSKPLIINSIIWNDSTLQAGEYEIYLSNTQDDLEISYSDINDTLIYGTLIDGGGNIWGEDPMFYSPDSLIISTDSPCLNAGTDAFTCECGVTNYCPAYDIMGIGRPQSGGFEMGAYELIFTDIPAHEKDKLEAAIYPNPFNSNTTINYNLEINSQVRITVLNGFGQIVAEPFNGWQTAGEYRVIFNAEGLPAGIYFYRIEAGNQKMNGKMLLVKP